VCRRQRPHHATGASWLAGWTRAPQPEHRQMTGEVSVDCRFTVAPFRLPLADQASRRAVGHHSSEGAITHRRSTRASRAPDAVTGKNGEVRTGNLFGPDATFAGVPAADLSDRASYQGAGAVIVGAPFDGGTSHRAGCRFGPQAIRLTDYLPHDGRRPHLALGVDPLVELGVVDAGDVVMVPGHIEESLERLEQAVTAVAGAGAVPVVLGGDHTIALPDVTGVARAVGWGQVAVVHFDAHADTADIQFGSLFGHGTPMRRLIESGAARGDRFLQIGLRGYWPEPETLDWMAGQGMRSFEMTEIVARGLDDCLSEAFAIATDGCAAVFLSVDIDVVDPGHAPGTGTPEPGGLSSRQLLDAVRRVCIELPVAGIDVVEVSPPYDHAEITAYLANRVVLECLAGVAWRRLAAEGGTARRATAPLLEGRGPN
jgi:agmatinase